MKSIDLLNKFFGRTTFARLVFAFVCAISVTQAHAVTKGINVWTDKNLLYTYYYTGDTASPVAGGTSYVCPRKGSYASVIIWLTPPGQAKQVFFQSSGIDPANMLQTSYQPTVWSCGIFLYSSGPNGSPIPEGRYDISAYQGNTVTATATYTIVGPAPATTFGPVITAGPTTTTASVGVTINKNGTGYYLVLPAASAVPSVTAVQAGTSIAMTAGALATINLSGLAPSTSYKLYFVAKDNSNQVQAAVSAGLPITTQQGIPPNYSDSWWNPNESGWGITITDHGSNAFVQWYTYDVTGHNQKYVISGGTFTNNKCQFTGAIQHVTGPSWTAPTFDPNQVVRTTVGSGTFNFCPTGLPAGTIVFNYTADGVTGSKQLTRLSFGNDVPHWGGMANTGAPDFTDLWWNPAESGWGVSVTQHGNNIFFRIFVYDTDGRPLLFVVPGVAFITNKSFTGAIQGTTGPWFGTVPFDPTQVIRTNLGTATLTFSDANNGVLSYTVNGITKTKSITRLGF
ncbi:MAG: hypothetical protein V4568_18380 [Pseudomonadota bacterium]